MRIYQSIDEAIEREIVQPLEYSGVVEDAREEFDVEGIADDILEYYQVKNSKGSIRLDKSGYKLKKITPEEFWQIVAKFDLVK